MHSARFRNTFLRVLKFLQIKEEDLISEANQFCRKSELFGPPLLYFDLTSFEDPNSSSFIRFLCILHDSGELFSEPWNFSKLKSGDLISGGESILQKVWIIWSPFLYFNFKSFMDPKWSPFIRFQCILHDSEVLFSESCNFYKLKRRT